MAGRATLGLKAMTQVIDLSLPFLELTLVLRP